MKVTFLFDGCQKWEEVLTEKGNNIVYIDGKLVEQVFWGHGPNKNAFHILMNKFYICFVACLCQHNFFYICRFLYWSS